MEKLEGKLIEVSRTNIEKDRNGFYLPFCTGFPYGGIIKDEKKCRPECRHYIKLYFPAQRKP